MGEDQRSRALRAAFVERLSTYETLRSEAEFALKHGLKQSDIAPCTVTSRVKEVDSFLRKARLKDCREPFDEIKDIVGLRVVCLLRSQVAPILQIVRAQFQALEVYDWDDGRDPSVFGYTATHVIARLSEQCRGARYDGLHDLVFEIQLRTIMMDAWASLSHHVDYKAAEAIPSHLRRDFFALSGMFHLIDTQFESLCQGSERSRADVEAAVRREGSGFDMEVHLDSLTAYLRTRLPERELGDFDSLSRLVAELVALGYQRLSQVEDVLERGAAAFAAGEPDHPPEEGGRYTAAGVVRMSLRLVDSGYRPAQ
jgi:ppGpp synthetase/RelA/SpoT-type nucleotidyltranferase